MRRTQSQPPNADWGWAQSDNIPPVDAELAVAEATYIQSFYDAV